jgi:hypothetical protein
MKRLMIFVVSAMALSLTSLHAQNFFSLQVHFDHPVEVVGNELPAGDYRVKMIQSNGAEPLVLFQSADGRDDVIALATRDLRGGADRAQETEVILDRQGSLEHVARIQIAGSLTDLVLTVPSAGNVR